MSTSAEPLRHVVFVAPYFLDATLAFIDGAVRVPGIALTVISQEPESKIPAALRARLSGHWQVRDALDPQLLVDAIRELAKRFGPAERLLAALEQLQEPLAVAREFLGIDGMSVDASRNFRDKSRMKTVLQSAGVPCARHTLASNADMVKGFSDAVGLPIVLKPAAGAGGKGTVRLDTAAQLHTFLQSSPPHAQHPVVCEEYVHGTEYSFDSVVIGGRPVWHSISSYMPSPLEVMENDWIQWCVLLPRDISGPEYDPIREAGFRGIEALGLRTGLSHMEWFSLPSGRIAVSEVGARPPGAQFTTLLSYAHDLNFYHAWPRLMVREEFDVPERKYACGAAYIRGQGSGRVRRIRGLDEAQQRWGQLVVEVKLPREGKPPRDGYEGDGYVIVRHPETGVVQEALQGIVKTLHVELG